VNVLGLCEVVTSATARRREATLAGERARLAAEQSELATVRVELASMRKHIERSASPEPSALPEPAAPEPAALPEPPAITEGLILLADRLVDLTGDAAPSDGAQAAAVLSWLRAQVEQLLDGSEIERIIDDGALDLRRHEVVATRPAPTPDRVEHIAGTVRPGYRWRTELLRHQQVVAYTETGFASAENAAP
jgi:hypothetical protein